MTFHDRETLAMAWDLFLMKRIAPDTYQEMKKAVWAQCKAEALKMKEERPRCKHGRDGFCGKCVQKTVGKQEVQHGD